MTVVITFGILEKYNSNNQSELEQKYTVDDKVIRGFLVVGFSLFTSLQRRQYS